jgi:hypothetical protein
MTNVLKMPIERLIKRPTRRIEFIRSKIVNIEQDLRVCKAILEIDCEDLELLKEYNRLISELDQTMLKLMMLVKVDSAGKDK